MIEMWVIPDVMIKKKKEEFLNPKYRVFES